MNPLERILPAGGLKAATHFVVGVLLGATVLLATTKTSPAQLEGAVVDLRANSLNATDTNWINEGTAGGAYPANPQSTNAPANPPLGETGNIPWTSGLIADGNGPDGTVWGTSSPVGTEPQFGIENFTLELWLHRLSGAQGGELQIACLRSPGHNTRFGIDLDSPAFVIQLSELKGANSDPVASVRSKTHTGVVLDTNGFHHMVWTYNDSSDLLSLYFDGGAVPDYTKDLSTDPNAPDFDSSDLCTWSTVLNNFDLEWSRRFPGRINTVRVYDFVLTGAQVHQNFLAGPALIPLEIVAAPHSVGLSFDAILGVSYQVQAAGDLVNGMWSAKPYTITGTGGIMYITEPDSGAAHLNYRVVRTQ